MPRHVYIYDSASNPGNLHSNVENVIAVYRVSVRSRATIETVVYMQLQMSQSIHSSTVRYAGGDTLRFHLIECLENKIISLYPGVGVIDQSNR